VRGAWQFPGSSHKLPRLEKNRPRHRRHAFRAIAQSCDTYFYAISDLIGIDRMHDFLIQFGLGEETGIDLLGERTGLVPIARVEEARHSRRRDLQVWFPAKP
jgi:penicillin-binding protein 2